MSIRQGKKLIASSTTNGFSLFDCKWADHILNNISWLRADTFSWQSGDVYVAAYEHLAEDVEVVSYIVTALNLAYDRTPSDDVVINGTQYYAWTSAYGAGCLTTSATPQGGDNLYNQDGTVDIDSIVDFVTYIKGAQTETIGDITISYGLADDGHKICLPDQESNISALYQQTGVAWYYILDTVNKQFKLPRTKFGFTGIRNGVGGYVAPGLPDITGKVGQIDFSGSRSFSGAFYNAQSPSGDTGATHSGGTRTTVGFRARQSNSIYGNSTTVQPPATQMYLYFYVGNYVENATTVDVGKLTEIVNDFDIDTFKPEVDEAKNEAIVDISDAKTDAIDSLTNLATDLGSSLKYGNVGDIFYTSRLDVSLNGAVECNGNLYNTTDFSGAQSIGNLLRDSKVPYISLSEHQTTVDTYGSCRCFGWDGGTEFRVPKLADVFIEAGVAASEGEFITAGLPNITGTFGSNGTWATSDNKLFTRASAGNESHGWDGSSSTRIRFTMDASKYNSIYGNSTTVQPPAVRYRAMVQLAFGATDDAVVTAGNVLADIAGIKDGDGFTQPGKNAIISWGMPDYSAAVSMSSGSSAPKNGWAIAHGVNATITYSVNDVSVAQGNWASGNWSGNWNLQIMVSAGDVVTGGSWEFIPCKGVN